jgi:hypothetical protein
VALNKGKMINQEYIEEIAREYCRHRDAVRVKKTPANEGAFSNYKNWAIGKLKPLVEIRSSRYKKFANHPDLEQDGYEALMLALNSFDPKKGSFTWWADKYIATRISRCANSHSVIHIPIKQARETKPLKVNEFPLMIDDANDPLRAAVDNQTSDRLIGLINQLEGADIIKHVFGIGGNRTTTIKSAMVRFGKSRSEIMKIINESKEKLKEMIEVSFNGL